MMTSPSSPSRRRLTISLRSACLAIAMTTAAAAQEEPSRLRFTLPAGWTPSIDGKTLWPPGGNVAVVLAPSTAFAGNAEQWATEAWNGAQRELKLVAGPVPGTQGGFLTRAGVFQQANGTNVWMCLNTLVRDGRGECLIYMSGDEAQFRNHLAALGTLLDGTKVATPPAPAPRAPPAPPAPPARTPGPPIAGGDEVAGLYVASTRQIRLSPLGSPGGGSWEWRSEFYLLSPDGRVFRGPDLPDVPGGDISRFDYEAARRGAPAASGTYTVRGSEVVLTMGESGAEVIVATRPEPEVLEIRKTKYKRSSREKPGTPPSTSGSTSLEPASTSPPAAVDALPLLVHQVPPEFRGPPEQGSHHTRDLVSGKLEVYDFRSFRGDFEKEFRATLLREWIAAESREARVVGAPVIESTAMPGADQVLTAVFREEFRGQPSALGGDWDAPRLRLRIAVLASGAVAISDITLRDQEAWNRLQASLDAFGKTLSILPPSPAMTRADRLPVAGLWRAQEKRQAMDVSDNDPRSWHRVGTEFYILSDDGRVHCQGPAPEGDIHEFDFEPRKPFLHNAGYYTRRGDQLVLRLGSAPFDTIRAQIKGPDRLEILGVAYARTVRWDPARTALPAPPSSPPVGATSPSGQSR
jgi:hypothetical protein